MAEFWEGLGVLDPQPATQPSQQDEMWRGLGTLDQPQQPVMDDVQPPPLNGLGGTAHTITPELPPLSYMTDAGLPGAGLFSPPSVQSATDAAQSQQGQPPSDPTYGGAYVVSTPTKEFVDQYNANQQGGAYNQAADLANTFGVGQAMGPTPPLPMVQEQGARPSWFTKKFEDMTLEEQKDFLQKQYDEMVAKGYATPDQGQRWATQEQDKAESAFTKRTTESLMNQTSKDQVERFKIAQSLPQGTPERGAADLAVTIGDLSAIYKKDKQSFGQWLNDPRNALQYMPFLGGAINTKRNISALAAANAIQSGNYTQEDLVNVADYLIKAHNSADRGVWKNAADITARIPAFMAEMYVTGGAFNFGKAGAEKVLEKATGGAIKAGAEKVLEQGVAKGLTKFAVGRGAGLAAQTLVSPHMWVANIAERRIPKMDYVTTPDGNVAKINFGPPEKWFPAILHGVVDAGIELGTERGGEYLSEGVQKAAAFVNRNTLGRMAKAGLSSDDILRRIAQGEAIDMSGKTVTGAWDTTIKGRRALAKVMLERNKMARTIGQNLEELRRTAVEYWLSKPGRNIPMLQHFIDAGKWNGIWSEYLEERAGDALRLLTGVEGLKDNELGQILTGDWKSAGKNIAAELLSFGGFDSLIKGANHVTARALGMDPDPDRFRIDSAEKWAWDNLAAAQQMRDDVRNGLDMSRGYFKNVMGGTITGHERTSAPERLDFANRVANFLDHLEKSTQRDDGVDLPDAQPSAPAGPADATVPGAGRATPNVQDDTAEKAGLESVAQDTVEPVAPHTFTPLAGQDGWQEFPPGTPVPNHPSLETHVNPDGTVLVRRNQKLSPQTEDIFPAGPVSGWSNDNVKAAAGLLGIKTKGLNNATIRKKVDAAIRKIDNTPNPQTPQEQYLAKLRGLTQRPKTTLQKLEDKLAQKEQEAGITQKEPAAPVVDNTPPTVTLPTEEEMLAKLQEKAAAAKQKKADKAAPVLPTEEEMLAKLTGKAAEPTTPAPAAKKTLNKPKANGQPKTAVAPEKPAEKPKSGFGGALDDFAQALTGKKPEAEAPKAEPPKKLSPSDARIQAKVELEAKHYEGRSIKDMDNRPHQAEGWLQDAIRRSPQELGSDPEAIAHWVRKGFSDNNYWSILQQQKKTLPEFIRDFQQQELEDSRNQERKVISNGTQTKTKGQAEGQAPAEGLLKPVSKAGVPAAPALTTDQDLSLTEPKTLKSAAPGPKQTRKKRSLKEPKYSGEHADLHNAIDELGVTDRYYTNKNGKRVLHEKVERYETELQTLHDMVGSDPDGVRAIIKAAKERADATSQATLAQQYREVVAGNRTLAGFNAEEYGDETNIKGADHIADRLREGRYAELAAYTSSLGKGTVESGIPKLLRGGAKQFAEAEPGAHLAQAIYEHEQHKKLNDLGYPPEWDDIEPDDNAPFSLTGEGSKDKSPIVETYQPERTEPPKKKTFKQPLMENMPEDMNKGTLEGQQGMFNRGTAEERPKIVTAIEDMYGLKPGDIKVVGMPAKKEARSAAKVASLFGRKILWVVGPKSATFNGAAHPSDPNTIVLRADSPGNVRRVLAHELAHALGIDYVKDIPASVIKFFGEMRAGLRDKAGNLVDRDTWEKRASAYQRRMLEDDALWNREARAEMAGHWFDTDDKFRNRILGESPSLYEKLREFVLKMLGKLDLSDMDKAQRKMIEAFQAKMEIKGDDIALSEDLTQEYTPEHAITTKFDSPVVFTPQMKQQLISEANDRLAGTNIQIPQRGWSNLRDFAKSQLRLRPEARALDQDMLDQILADKQRSAMKRLTKNFARLNRAAGVRYENGLLLSDESANDQDPAKLLPLAVKVVREAVGMGRTNFKDFVKDVAQHLGPELTKQGGMYFEQAWDLLRNDYGFPLDESESIEKLLGKPLPPQPAPVPPPAKAEAKPATKPTVKTEETKPAPKPAATPSPAVAAGVSPPHRDDAKELAIALGQKGLTVKKTTAKRGHEVWEVTGPSLELYRQVLINLGASRTYKGKNGIPTRSFAGNEADPTERIIKGIEDYERTAPRESRGLERPNVVRTDKQPENAKILTARWEYTPTVDTSAIPKGVAKHLNEQQRQRVAMAVNAMDDPARGGFLDQSGTGTGKSFSGLATAKIYADRGHSVVIVAPNEAIGKPWEQETPIISGSWMTASKILGVPLELATEHLSELEPGKVYVTTYTRQRFDKIAEAIDGNTVMIFDEAHALKNLGKGLTRTANAGDAAAQRAKAVLYQTATPLDQPIHLMFLKRIGAWEGDSFTDQAHKLGMVERKSKVNVKDDKNQIVYEKDKDGNVVKGKDGRPKPLKTTKITYGNRPGVKRIEVRARMDALFDRLTAAGSTVAHQLNLKNVDIGFTVIPMPKGWPAQEAAIRAGLTGSGERHVNMSLRRQQEPHKIAAVVQMAKEELRMGRKVIIFLSRINHSAVKKKKNGMEIIVAESDGTAKTLREELEKAGVKNIAELHGNAGVKAAQSMDAFQKGEADVMIATVESGGTGINLDDEIGDAPRTMIMMTPPFSAVHVVQAAGRVWRLNTKSDPRIRFVFANTKTDRWNSAIIAHKLSLLHAAVGGEVEKLNITNEDEEEKIAEMEDKFSRSKGFNRNATEFNASANNLTQKGEQIANSQRAAQARARTPQSKEGTKLAKLQAKDIAKSKGPYTFGKRNIVNFLVDAVQSTLYVQKSQLTKKHPAHYIGLHDENTERPSGEGPHIIRSRTGGYDSGNIHEVFHALSGFMAVTDPDWHNDFTQDIFALTDKSIFPASQASAPTDEEAWAELGRRYITDPTTLPNEYYNSFEEFMRNQNPEMLQKLQDAQMLWQRQLDRPHSQQRSSLTHGNEPAKKGLWSRIRGWNYGMTFSLVNTEAARLAQDRELQNRAVGNSYLTSFANKEPTGIFASLLQMLSPKLKQQQKTLRKVRQSAWDTRADVDAAHQSATRARLEATRALYGTGAEGTSRAIRFLVTGETTSNVKGAKQAYVNALEWLNRDTEDARKLRRRLKKLGFKIPASPTRRHGDFAYFGSRSYLEIVTDGIEDPDHFKTFLQDLSGLLRYDVSIARRAAYEKGDLSYGKKMDIYHYPDMENDPPEKLRAELKSIIDAHPEYIARAKELQQWFDNHLFLMYLSGAVTLKELTRIKTQWKLPKGGREWLFDMGGKDFYIPIYRSVEDRNQDATRSGEAGEDTAPIHRAWGSDLPYRDLDKIATHVSAKTMDLYYNNRRRQSLVDYSKLLSESKELPWEARNFAANIAIKLKMDPTIVHNFKTNDKKLLELVAQALNEHAAKVLGVDIADLGPDFVEPEDVMLNDERIPVYGRKRPNMRNVMMVYEFGHSVPSFYHVPDPLTFEYATYRPATGKIGDGTVGGSLDVAAQVLKALTDPWKRSIVHALAFSINNKTRDTITQPLLASEREQMLKDLIPLANEIGYALAKWHGNMDLVNETAEMVQRSLNQDYAVEGRPLSGFQRALREGIAGYDPALENKHILAQATSTIASGIAKPFDLIRWGTGQRWLAGQLESMPRAGALYKAKLKGYSDEYALLRRDQATGNFGARPGSPTVSRYVQTLGFINPALQIMWGMGKNAYHPDPAMRARFWLIALPEIATVGFVASLANMAAMHVFYPPDTRDDLLANMAERSVRSRTQFMSLLGDMRLSFGDGLAGAMASAGWNTAERLILDPKLDAKQRKEMIWNLLTKAASLPGIGELVNNNLRAIIELGMGEGGYQFYWDEPIVSPRLIEQHRNDPALRTYDSVPTTYNQIGKWLNVSPLKVQYAIKSILGEGIDRALLFFERPEGTILEWPAIGKLFDRAPSGYNSLSVQSLAALNDRYEEARRTSEKDADPQRKLENQLIMEELTPYHEATNFVQDLHDASKVAHEQGRMDDYRTLKDAMVGVARSAMGYDPLTKFPDAKHGLLPAEVEEMIEKRAEAQRSIIKNADQIILYGKQKKPLATYLDRLEAAKNRKERAERMLEFLGR